MRRGLGRREERSRGLRLPARLSDRALARRRDRLGNGVSASREDSRGIRRPNNKHVFGDSQPESVRHRRRTLQRHHVHPPPRRGHRRNVRHRQRGSVRRVLQDAEVTHAFLRGLEPPGERGHGGGDHMHQVSRAAQRRPEEDIRQHGALPAAPLLRTGLRTADGAGGPAVPSGHRPGPGEAALRRKEHDVRVRPEAREVPDGGVDLPREDVDKGGGRADDERAGQEQRVLRRVDSEQREDGDLRHTAEGVEDGGHVRGEHDRDTGAVQEDL